MPTIWLLCHATCSYTSMQLQRECIKGNEYASVRATFADVLPINRVEFQDVNLLFRCVCYVRFSDSFASALRPLAVKKRTYNLLFTRSSASWNIY